MSSVNALTEQARSLLNRVLGYPEFRGEQAAIVTHVADGGDAWR